ncbi:MAG TPA: hybrid sensor histidine kinase/response regulator, partial [Polyangiaceae bacterium]|nr:hybrid sensor histidine kinase/response regulator [Polyangiaceae bacterium]
DTSEIPVVFLSVVDDPQQKMRAFEVGGADYVGKSFHAGEVLARIGHQLAILRLQREMRLANQRLLEAGRLKETFTAMLMHDLRSPLGAAQATIAMLARKIGESDSELRELAEISAGGLKQTVALINEVLDVYRSEQVEVTPVREPVDLAHVLRSVVQEAGLEARSRGVTLELSLSSGLEALGDRARLERAFANLIGNALKFTRAGGKVTLEARRIEGTLRVEVRDTGTGIAEGEVPYIFDLYRQAATGRQGGVGLGLAIVKRILDAHGATISVASQLGVGTTFSVDLSAA